MSKRPFICPCTLNTLYKRVLNNDHDGNSLRVTSVSLWMRIPRAEGSCMGGPACPQALFFPQPRALEGSTFPQCLSQPDLLEEHYEQI